MAAFTWLGSSLHDDLVDLGPLALLAPLLQQLDLASIIDLHVPPDPQRELSHGRILSLLLAARLDQPTALVNVADWAHNSGADLLWNIPASKLNDDRLGRALDALFEHRHSILTHITQRILEYNELSLERLHFDTTDVTFYGAYETSQARLPPDRDAVLLRNSSLPPAHITKGYLTDQRMLQVGVTSVVDDLGAVPVGLHVADGNRNGHGVLHEHFGHLCQDLALPAGMQLVSDRGTFSAEHVARLRRHGYHVLCAVPWDDYRALYDAQAEQLVWQEASYLSQEQQRRRQCASTLPQENYRLAECDHTLTDPRTREELPCRLVFVYSTSGAKQEQQRREQQITKIQTGLEQLAAKLQRGHPCTTYESMVRQITHLLGRRAAARYFTWELIPLTTAEQQALPAPKKGHKRPSHRLEFRFDAVAAAAQARYDGLSVLLATVPATDKSADTLFSEYKQQAYVELGHHQYKTPLAVRPVFLKSPERVEALLCLLHVALQVYQTLERRYRQRTPATAPAKERLRTAEGLLRAFAVYGVLVRRTSQGRTVHAGRLNSEQGRILSRLGLPTPQQFFASLWPPAPTQ